MGYLVIRGFEYADAQGQSNQIAVVEGWCEDLFDFQPKPSGKQPICIKGILR